MPMDDWVITNYRDSSLTGPWVYYRNLVNPNFADIHFSRCVDDSNRDHMATNDRAYYYFGVTNTFNPVVVPQGTQQTLIDAWQDYFAV